MTYFNAYLLFWLLDRNGIFSQVIVNTLAWKELPVSHCYMLQFLTRILCSSYKQIYLTFNVFSLEHLLFIRYKHLLSVKQIFWYCNEVKWAAYPFRTISLSQDSCGDNQYSFDGLWELFGYIQKQRNTKLLLHKDFMSQNQDENILNIPEVGEVFFLSPFLTLSLKIICIRCSWSLSLRLYKNVYLFLRFQCLEV